VVLKNLDLLVKVLHLMRSKDWRDHTMTGAIYIEGFSNQTIHLGKRLFENNRIRIQLHCLACFSARHSIPQPRVVPIAGSVELIPLLVALG
jgi:hypothetical protein